MVRIKLLLIALSFLLVGNVFAQDKMQDRPPHGQGPKGPFFEIREKLNLTEEQKKQVKELKQDSDMFAKQKELMAEKDKLRDLIKKEGSTEAEVLAQAEKLNKIQGQANIDRVKNIFAFKKILTPQQFDMLSEHMEKKRSDFRENFKDRENRRE